jgi:aminoglycoside 6-adenylyltransferase
MAANELPPPAIEMLWRGTRIVVDKDGLLQAVLSKPLPAKSVFQPPDQKTFTNLVHDFWFHTLWTAKHLRRGELWWAKMGCDVHLKNLLTEMLRWHAYAQQGAQFDTWMGGRFLEEWADSRAVEAFKQIFAHYEDKDIARALLATMHLFSWLSMETAQ